MSDFKENIEVVVGIIEDNETEEGLDIVNMMMTLVETLKADLNMTVETWEVFRQSINNMAAVVDNAVSEEIARLTAE